MASTFYETEICAAAFPIRRLTKKRGIKLFHLRVLVENKKTHECTSHTMEFMQFLSAPTPGHKLNFLVQQRPRKL